MWGGRCRRRGGGGGGSRFLGDRGGGDRGRSWRRRLGLLLCGSGRGGGREGVRGEG